MLKVVGRKGYLALLEHEPGRDEPVECLPQLAVRHFDSGLYQLVAEFTSADNGKLQTVPPWLANTLVIGPWAPTSAFSAGRAERWGWYIRCRFRTGPCRPSSDCTSAHALHASTRCRLDPR